MGRARECSRAQAKHTAELALHEAELTAEWHQRPEA